MFHTYNEALDWIQSRLRLGIKPGLKRMEWMLEKLGNPERKLKAIHVGGTNGKGSTVAYLRSILNEAGYQIGTFTSPYIEQFNERISLNGKPISDEEMISLVNTIKPIAEQIEETELGPPTEFEVITTMAFYFFGEIEPVDFTIFEVGLGGRFDSTNVIEPVVAIITNIGMDHMQILGNTISEIAFEKAGIIKTGVPVFTNSQNEEALRVIQTEADKKQSPFYQLGKDYFVSDYTPILDGEQFTFSTGINRFKNLQVSMVGSHQIENAAGALAAILYLQERNIIQVQEKQIRQGLKSTYWPARMEKLSNKPAIIIDGAHNAEGMKAFKAAMDAHYPDKNRKVVFAALKDKDLTDMFDTLKQMHGELYVTEFDFPRAASAEELKAMSKGNGTIEKDWRHLLRVLVGSLSDNDVLAVTGSLYFISEVKPFLVNLLKNNGKSKVVSEIELFFKHKKE